MLLFVHVHLTEMSVSTALLQSAFYIPAVQNTWCDSCSLYTCKQLFSLCYRAVTDSINTLLNACMSAAPGQKECDNALRNIQVWTCILRNFVKLFYCLHVRFSGFNRQAQGSSKEESEVTVKRVVFTIHEHRICNLH